MGNTVHSVSIESTTVYHSEMDMSNLENLGFQVSVLLWYVKIGSQEIDSLKMRYLLQIRPTDYGLQEALLAALQAKLRV